MTSKKQHAISVIIAVVILGACILQWIKWHIMPSGGSQSLLAEITVIALFFCSVLSLGLGARGKKESLAPPPIVTVDGMEEVDANPISEVPKEYSSVDLAVMLTEAIKPTTELIMEPAPAEQQVVDPTTEPEPVDPAQLEIVMPAEAPPHPDSGHPHFSHAAGRIIFP